MTTSPNTTPVSATTALNPLLAPDRISFRSALDHLQDALTADWQFFLRRKMPETLEKLEYGHQAAQAWSMCIEALCEVCDMDTAHPDLRAAAMELIQTTPGSYPVSSRVDILKLEIKRLSNLHFVGSDEGLYDLLFHAHTLNTVHNSNLQMMRAYWNN
ncbi:hypothetical protein [Planktotalea sp.]|uniref:hypothetical protein n=1 Tax=Planktotalea sp. TaxID=2029877 RepID=UPI003F6D214D